MINLQEYLKNDRQWTHEMRVAHAKYQLNKAEALEEKNFWRSVLDANKK